jgi:MoxR-like ATPase
MTTNPMNMTAIEQTAGLCAQVIAEVEKAVVGKRAALSLMMAAFLCPGGHILLEDFPGLAKTLIANSFATALGLDFRRIQFTPDLLPGDITGGYVFDSNQNRFELRKGPIFTQVLLADEINRASPKTQSALLEAMQEYQVTLEGETQALAQPFIVIATQNPIEYEGTFPLPEAQLDRFLVKLSIGYPRVEEEDEILKRRAERKQDQVALQPVITAEILLAMRAAVEEVYIDPDVRRFIVNLADKTRSHRQVVVGVSPRGSLGLLKLSRAWAAMQGRDFVTPDDVKQFIQPVFAHRIMLDPSLWGAKKSENALIDEIIRAVPAPVFQAAPVFSAAPTTAENERQNDSI